MNWGEFSRCLDGYKRRLETQVEISNSLNHTLGRYISFAFNDPKHYPDKPYPMTEREQDRINNASKEFVATTDEQRIAMARIKYGRKQ